MYWVPLLAGILIIAFILDLASALTIGKSMLRSSRTSVPVMRMLMTSDAIGDAVAMGFLGKVKGWLKKESDNAKNEEDLNEGKGRRSRQHHRYRTIVRIPAASVTGRQSA